MLALFTVCLRDFTEDGILVQSKITDNHTGVESPGFRADKGDIKGYILFHSKCQQGQMLPSLHTCLTGTDLSWLLNLHVIPQDTFKPIGSRAIVWGLIL